MMKIGMLEAARPGRVGKIGTGVRIFSLLVLGCSAASAAALIYPAKIPTADVVRIAPRTETVQVSAASTPVKVETRLTSSSAAWTSPAPSEATPARAPVRQIPLIAGG